MLTKNVISLFSQIKLLQPTKEVMGRKALMAKLDRKFASMKTTIREELDKADHVSTTCDIWSRAHRGFLGMTVHFFTKDLKRKSYAISCMRFRGSHSYDRITEKIKEVLEDWGIQWKTSGMTTDNATNFEKAFKHHGTQQTQAATAFADSSGSDEEEHDDDLEAVDLEEILAGGANMKELPMHFRWVLSSYTSTYMYIKVHKYI